MREKKKEGRKNRRIKKKKETGENNRAEEVYCEEKRDDQQRRKRKEYRGFKARLEGKGRGRLTRKRQEIKEYRVEECKEKPRKLGGAEA